MSDWPRLMRLTSSDTPEKRLLKAILNRSVRDLTAASESRHQSDPDEFHNLAFEWINSNSYAAFSFLWVCDLLELEPEKVRKFCMEKYEASKANLVLLAA